MKGNIKPMKLWFLWVLATTTGWVVTHYIGFSFGRVVLTSWAQVPGLVFILTLNGLWLGGVVGLLQWLILRAWVKEKGWWILATMAGSALGSPISLLLNIGLAVNVAPGLLNAGSSLSLSMPLDLMMIWTGALIAIGQWPVLRQFIPAFKIKEAVLWILGTALAWGLAYWGAGYTLEMGFSLPGLNAVAGGIVGIVTGATLAILLSQPPESARLESTRPLN